MMQFYAMERAYSKWPVHQIRELPPVRTRNRYQYYVDHQIVITGRSGEIERVVEAVNATVADEAARPHGQRLPRIQTPPLSTIHLAEMLRTGDLLDHPALTGLADLEIRLYDLVGDESESGMWAAIRLIHEQAAAQKLIVLADPNLIVGNPISGGAGGVTGGPFGQPVSSDDAGQVKSEHRFWNQWAFQPPDGRGSTRRQGINLEKRPGPVEDPGQRILPYAGDDVRFFVLDTADSELLAQTPVCLPGKKDHPLPISVQDLKHAVQFAPLQEAEDISAHGRFVCGLLNRMAPQADIHLLRVLDDTGRGELFTLTCALLLIASYGLLKPSADPERPLDDTVVNLSLSADLSEDRILVEGVRAAIDSLWDAVQGRYPTTDLLYRLLSDIYNRFYYGPSLRIPILLLKELGAVIVAAAGNESADRYGNLPKLVPARYPEVIGVGASNYLGKLSSFSNSADVLAPGGGHADPESPIMDLKKLAGQGGDLGLYALYSLVPESVCPDGLAYWWGTSFSTPLVSGLAALVLQKYRAEKYCGPAPEEVMDYIRKQAKNGTIDVQATLKAVKAKRKKLA